MCIWVCAILLNWKVNTHIVYLASSLYQLQVMIHLQNLEWVKYGSKTVLLYLLYTKNKHW